MIDIALISLIVMCSLKLIVISLLHIYNYIALCIYVLSTGILATARDWQLLVDLEQQLKFPNRIVTTTLRPDVVLLSDSTKQVVLLELTVPWEDRLEEAFERKLAKYEGTSQRVSTSRMERQGVSQSRSEAGALRPDPCAEPSVC